MTLISSHSSPRQIDVEAGRIAVGAGEVERRIVGFGEKPDHGEAGQIGPVRTPARVPEAGHRLRRRFDGGFGGGVCACAVPPDSTTPAAAAIDSPASRRGRFEAVFAAVNEDDLRLALTAVFPDWTAL